MKQPMNARKELRTVEQCDAALAAGTAYVASNRTFAVGAEFRRNLTRAAT